MNKLMIVKEIIGLTSVVIFTGGEQLLQVGLKLKKPKQCVSGFLFRTGNRKII